MRTKIFLTIILCGFFKISSAQPDSLWSKWTWLVGEWSGEGNGKPGSGGGTFNFKPDLDQKILVRKSH